MYFIKFVGVIKEGTGGGDIEHTVEAEQHITKHYRDGKKRVAVIRHNTETHYTLGEDRGYHTAFVMNSEGKTVERISVKRKTAEPSS